MYDQAVAAHKRRQAQAETARMLIGGGWRDGAETYDDRDPYRGEVVAHAPVSQAADVEAAVEAAAAARDAAAAVPGFERAALLRRVGALIAQRSDDIARAIARETGKAIRDARAEVARSADTVALSAEEAIRITGEHIPIDGSAMGAGRIAFTLRFPVGVVAAITPFNAPFNLACHKVAPAIAAGNAVVLKAPPQAPLCVHKLAELFVDAGAPAGLLNVLYGEPAGPLLVAHPKVDFITFTGSSRTGAAVKAASGLRRVALELGGDGPTIVHADADIDGAAKLCALNAMRLAGQSCISVQTVYVHRAIADSFTHRLVAAVESLKVGDPMDDGTDVGTLIDEDAARRVDAWVREAVAGGARLLTGGARNGAQYAPTVLADVTPAMKVVCEEVFGPVVGVAAYDDLEEAFARINASRYGLQCGLFSASLETALRAIRCLRVGGVIVNGTSTWRTDQLAYGGVKASGEGREGPRYAIREMTDERLVVFNG